MEVLVGGPDSPAATSRKSTLWFNGFQTANPLNQTVVLAKEAPVPVDAKMTDHKCLSFDKDIDALVNVSSHIFVIMPDKAAGSSVKDFMGECEKHHKDELLRLDGVFQENALSHSLEMPTVIADHVEEEKHLLHTIKHTPASGLIIYIYREETDREASAIQHVVQNRLCLRSYRKNNPVPDVPIHYEEDGSCIIDDEEQFIEQVIKPRYWEIGYGVFDTLTCTTHEAIRKEGPNMIMINYKQADSLLQLIAKHQCPRLVNKKFHSNVSKSKTLETKIKLHSGDTVSTKEWINSKRGQFGFFQPFEEKYEPQCKAETLELEKKMSTCPDEAIKIGGIRIRRRRTRRKTQRRQ